MPIFAKTFKQRVASTLGLALLFMQMATAAYACNLPVEKPTAIAALATMEGCVEHQEAGGSMSDPAQPALCIHHCQTDGGASEPPSGNVQLPIAAPALLATALVLPTAVPNSSSVFLPRVPPRQSAPPLSVLHCCYRI